MARCATFAVAGIRNRRNFAHFSPWHRKYGIGDPKRLTWIRGQVYTCRPNLVVIDQSWWAVGRGMTDKTDRQTEWNDNKAHSLRT